MIVFPGHSVCFVPVMSFSLSYRRFRVFQFTRGSLPLAFCFVPVMRFCVAVPTVPGFSVYPRQFAFGVLFRPGHVVCVIVPTIPGFSVYPRQFAFGALAVFFRLFFHLPQARITQKKSDEFMNCPLRFLALRGNEHFQFSGVSDRFAEIVIFVFSFRLPPRVFIK